MKRRKKHHFIAEQIWRGMRGLLLFIAITVWLLQDGLQTSDLVVANLCVGAILLDQFRGWFCRKIEKFFGWKEDFYKWE